MSDKYTAEQYLSVKRNTSGGCFLTKTEADQLGEMMEQAAQMMREREVGGAVTDEDVELAHEAYWSTQDVKGDNRPAIRVALESFTARRAAVPDAREVARSALATALCKRFGMNLKAKGCRPHDLYPDGGRDLECLVEALAAALEVTK